MRFRASLVAVSVPVAALALAAPALAHDNGEGLVGETDDKIITFSSFGVIVFFVVLVIVLSAIQGWLEKRKEERKAAELRQRIGW
jgi:uncharacterized protein HemY